MKCFNHHENDAVGTCKHCCKGLCVECVTDVGGGLACTATCVQAVTEITELIAANSAASVISKGSAAYFWAVFLVVLGLLFIVTPLFSGMPAKFLFFSTSLGSAFVLFGIAFGLYQRLWRKRLQEHT